MQGVHVCAFFLLASAVTAQRFIENDPCTAILNVNVFVVNGDSFVSPSLWQNCAESLLVDANNMISHIQSLKTLTRQHHVFFDIANDPSQSEPAEIRADLGNAYPRPDEGIVNIDSELNAIIDDVVSKQSASLATFWDINQAFLKYRDGHVFPPFLESQLTDFSRYLVFAAPVRFSDTGNYTITPRYRLDQNQRLQLSMTYARLDIETQQEEHMETHGVVTIDGVLVHDFMLGLGRNEAMPAQHPTLGARINFYTNKNIIWDITASSVPFFGANPLKVLPDRFIVTYTDGSQDTFVALIDPFRVGLFPNANLELLEANTIYRYFDRSQAEQFINAPGAQYDAYSRSINAYRPQNRRTKETTAVEREAVVEVPPILDHFPLDDEVYVLKLQSFSGAFDDFVTGLRNVLQSANSGGQTKLMLDLSGNSGGQVLQSYLLMMVLMPETSLAWYLDQWEANWNDSMDEWLAAGKTLVEQISSIRLAQQELILAEDVTDAQIAAFQESVNGMVELCTDALDISQNLNFCNPLFFLSDSLDAFILLRTQPSYEFFLENLERTADLYHPWSTILFGRDEVQERLQDAGHVNRIRGGMLSRTTGRFDVEDMPWLYANAQAIVTESGGNLFTDYVFVSDGLSVSSGAIAPYSAGQLYRNKQFTNATRRVSLIAYGGTGRQSDLTFASIPAAVQGVNLEFPLIGVASLRSLISAMPRTTPELQTFIEEYNEYVATVAKPPFFGDTQPSFPVFAYYDNTMGPDALPLQFVRLPLNGYIPTLFPNNGMGGADLPALHEAAKIFFYLEETPLPTTSSPTMAVPTAVPSESGLTTATPPTSAGVCHIVTAISALVPTMLMILTSAALWL